MKDSINWESFQYELKAFVFRKVKDKAVSEDIVQDVFIKVHHKLPQLKDSEKMASWIYRITLNSVYDYFRTKSAKPILDAIEWESEYNALNACVASYIKRLIVTLPDKYRQAFQLAEIDNVSQVELANRLGISYSGAKTRVQRARQMLKSKVEEVLIIKTDPYGNVLVCEDKSPKCCS